MMIEIAGFEIDVFYWTFVVVSVILVVLAEKVINKKVKERIDRKRESATGSEDAKPLHRLGEISSRRVAVFLFLFAFSVGTHFFVDGISLPNKPDMNEVSSVVVEHTDYPGETRERSEELMVKATVAILSELDYSLMRKPPEGEPVVKITYIMKDNTEIVVEANEETVWWNGKTYAIKEEGAFVKSCKLLFYPQE